MSKINITRVKKILEEIKEGDRDYKAAQNLVLCIEEGGSIDTNGKIDVKASISQSEYRVLNFLNSSYSH